MKGVGRIVSKSQDSKRLSNAGIYQDNSVLNQQGNVDNYRKLKGRSLYFDMTIPLKNEAYSIHNGNLINNVEDGVVFIG